jgi:hypothetical protein
MTRQALILPERCVETWTSDAPATVWYFGESYAVWTKLHERASAACKFAAVGDALNRWAKQLTEPLRELDAAVTIDDPAGWAASGIGCRGRFETPVTSFACCCATFVEAMEGGGRHVFAVSDEDLGRLIYAVGRERGWDVSWERHGKARRRWPGVIFQVLRTIRDRIVSLRHYGRRRLHVRRMRRRYPLDLEKLRRADTLLVIWGRASTFQPGGGIKDGWFVDLPDALRREGRELAYLIQPLDWADQFAAIAENTLASDEPALMIEDAYTIGDLLRAAFATLRAPAQPKRLQAGNLDLTPALRMAMSREVRRAPTLAHVQKGVGPLLHRLGMKPRTVIHLYEGQPWERGLRMSIRNALPEASVVAVQHMPFPPLFLNAIPSSREIATGEVPDTLMVLGPRIADFFRALGLPDRRLAVGGALRFTGVKTLAGSGARRDVLCCAGLDWQESHELAHKAAQAVARFADLRLVVNFHPQTPAAMKASVKSFVLDRLSADVLLRIEFSDLGVRDLIASSGAVLYADTNAAYEAFAAGCELVFVGRDSALDYDKLPPGWATHCRSVDEIAAALARCQSRTVPVDRDERLRQLSAYLADVDLGAFLAHM